MPNPRPPQNQKGILPSFLWSLFLHLLHKPHAVTVNPTPLPFPPFVFVWVLLGNIVGGTALVNLLCADHARDLIGGERRRRWDFCLHFSQATQFRTLGDQNSVPTTHRPPPSHHPQFLLPPHTHSPS